MPKYRKKMTKRQSKKDFRNKSGVHKKNRIKTNVRGGYRL